jgi:hypothetical protein
VVAFSQADQENKLYHISKQELIIRGALPLMAYPLEAFEITKQENSLEEKRGRFFWGSKIPIKMLAATAALNTIYHDQLFQEDLNNVLHCGICLEMDAFIQRLRLDIDSGMLEVAGNQYGCKVVVSKNVPLAS